MPEEPKDAGLGDDGASPEQESIEQEPSIDIDVAMNARDDETAEPEEDELLEDDLEELDEDDDSPPARPSIVRPPPPPPVPRPRTAPPEGFRPLFGTEAPPAALATEMPPSGPSTEAPAAETPPHGPGGHAPVVAPPSVASREDARSPKPEPQFPESAFEPATNLPSGASQLPPASIESIEAVAAAVERLRAEVGATEDRARRARLLYEAAEIQERGGDEPGAARDYLAAFNSDTSFREPLEGLVRLLERRRSLANLGKLIEALVVAASSPEERARALTQRAIFFEDVQKDLEGARGLAREATETGAGLADLGPAWLALEMVAAKLGDAAQREEALSGRAEMTGDPTWRGLLLVDAAELAAAAGDVDRALGALERARTEGGAAAYRATLATERIVQADPGLPGSADARARQTALADALEARTLLIDEAMAGEDGAGVPAYRKQLAVVIDLLLRAAEARRHAGEHARAGELVDRAIGKLGDDTPPSIARAVLGARLRYAQLAGDTKLAAELASQRLEAETDPGLAASLALRIAEHAAHEGDVDAALAALTTAKTHDPTSAPVRALAQDLLDGNDGAAGFATELEDLAAHVTKDDARGRLLVLAAWVWTVRAKDATKARACLLRAAGAGVAKETLAHLGRSLASVAGDRAWYEAATRELVLATTEDPSLLWVEIVRLRLAQGDEQGAAEATASLREGAGGAWLGRVLDGLASPDLEPARARTALEELAKDVDDPALRRSLAVVCAQRAEEADVAIAHLAKLADEDPADPLVAAWLGDLLRRAGDRAGAAARAKAAAERTLDEELRAARHLEAGFETWRLGQRAGAVQHFEAASETAPAAARPALSWASRGLDVDTLDGRRRALDVAGSDAGVQLERFALEASLGDPDEAAAALDGVDIASSAALRLAGALGRLAWPKAADVDAEAAALDTLGQASDAARTAAAAERLRLAREARDPAVTDAARAWLDAGGGAAAAVEWLAGAMASGDPETELAPRRALAAISNEEAREALLASATMLEWAMAPSEDLPLASGSSHATRLVNLELAPPGCEPGRRASALAELDGALGADAETDALGLAGWSFLAAGEVTAALDAFRTVSAGRPDDLHAWEGMRAAAEELGDHEAYAVACEQLGVRCADGPRGAAFWEQAALAWSELGSAFEGRAESALDASFGRDATRAVAFDRLFRRVRERKDHDKLLALITRRLEVTDNPAEIAKLYWEQARAQRERGNPDLALESLQHVFMFDEEHVGALALTGEILIRRGMFAEAASMLARLAGVEAAPPKNRVTAGVAAVDLYENKLNRHEDALAVLLGLHRAKLTTLPVRERLARAAARTGAWDEATKILEELMVERPEREGRIEAARLALAIHRDRRNDAKGALPAATKLLEESPSDGEAIDLLLAVDPQSRELRPLFDRARDALLMALHETPGDLDAHRRLARVAHAVGDAPLEQATLSCAVALGGPDGSSEQMIALYSSQKPRVPAVSLTEPMLRQILASGDDGPLADLFVALGPTLSEALGPTREVLGVTKKDRVDPRAGLALRSEIATWAGAFGITNFDLYIGGKDPGGVQGVPGDPPAIVVGSGVNAPLSPTTRARVVREIIGIVRGTTVTRWRDDATIAAIAVAACNLVKVPVPSTSLAVLAEVERLLGKALGRRTKAQIEPICRAYASTAPDPRQWAARARASQARAAALASGDVSVVLADVFGEAVGKLGAVVRDDLRAQELVRFVLSRPYFELRRALGLEGST